MGKIHNYDVRPITYKKKIRLINEKIIIVIKITENHCCYRSYKKITMIIDRLISHEVHTCLYYPRGCTVNFNLIKGYS